MPGLISKPHGEDLDFELFSNIVLKFTAILMVVLVLLAINTGQKIDQIISPYRFSGGSARPQLHYSAYETPGGRNNAKILISFQSPSFAETTATKIDPNTRELVGAGDQTFDGRTYARPYYALLLLAGIAQDALPVNGQQTAFIVPNFDMKGFNYTDKANKYRSSPASEGIGRSFLKLWSGLYANPVYPTRAFSEYRNTIVRVYVETCVANRRHSFEIGDRTFTAADVKSGLLDFLTGLSSTNTEIVYLGDCASDVAAERQSRLDFYTAHGFADAAKHLRSRLSPDAADRKLAAADVNLLPGWDQLSPQQKSTWFAGAKGDAALARSRYEAANADEAIVIYRNALLEEAMEKGVKPDVYGLPTILAYPDAWQAFVDDRLKSAPTPPDWFVTELLQPIGFDKRVVSVEAQAK
jgi:hypothetical protein